MKQESAGMSHDDSDQDPSPRAKLSLTQDQLLEYYAPYDESERTVVESIVQHSILPGEILRASTASAIHMIEKARALPVRFSLRQVFQRYSIQTPEGQTLFQLINQLCHILDKQAQQEFIQECFSAASWMQDAKRRDQFFSSTSSWGLSIANRFFSASPMLKNKKDESSSIASMFARKFSSPIMHKTIVQAVGRLTDPLIFAKDWLEALESSQGKSLYLRPAFPYAITLKTADDNTKAYLELIDEMKAYCAVQSKQAQPMLHLDIHHFSGPIDIRQESRLHLLYLCLRPIVQATHAHQIPVILSATQGFATPLLRVLFHQLLNDLNMAPNTLSTLGIELSAADPSSFSTLNALQLEAKQKEIQIPVRITKERTKPSLTHSSAIHAAYLAMAQATLLRKTGVKPLFVSHNTFTLACLHHLSDAGPLTDQDYEIHHRCGVGIRCQSAFKEQFKTSNVRYEAPLGEKHHHHHMLLQRLRETADPQSFLNRLYHDNITTAELVTHPLQNLKKVTVPKDNFWRGQIIRPHQPALSIISNQLPSQELHYQDVESTLEVFPHRSLSEEDQQDRRQALYQAHLQAIELAPLWVKLIVNSMDIPRHAAELQVEAALRQQAELLAKQHAIKNPMVSIFPKGQILWIASGHRPLSPMLEQITLALLLGNQVVVKPASATLDLITQILQPFWLAGFSQDDCRAMPMSHESLQTFLQINGTIDTVIFDGSQSHGKSLSLCTLQNLKQPPIPFWSTPASSCLSTQGMCVIDETASDQELHLLVSDAWALGPMIILATPRVLPELQIALTHWRSQLVIGDAENRDTHLTKTQILQPFPFEVAPICKSLGLSDPISISAPHQESPYFQIVTIEEESLLPLLRALAQNAQLNRCTLLTRMPIRIKNILNYLPAHEIHLGWPKEHTSFVFRGLDTNTYCNTTHILRHHRLHPWLNNGKFDITRL